MLNNLNLCYEILGLKPDASLADVKKTYRNLVKLWHPDTFPDNQLLKKNAHDNLILINTAYEMIISYNPRHKYFINDDTNSTLLHNKLKQHRPDSNARYKSNTKNIISLLGKSLRSIDVKQYIFNLDELPNIEQYGCYYQFKRNGIGLLFNYDTLITISLFSEGYRGYKQYAGPISDNLNFNDNRQIINKKIGKPAKSGRWKDLWGRNQRGVWDKWVFVNYSIYIQYYKDETISMITFNDEKSMKK